MPSFGPDVQLGRQPVPDYQPVADAAVAGAIGAVGVAVVAAAALVILFFSRCRKGAGHQRRIPSIHLLIPSPARAFARNNTAALCPSSLFPLSESPVSLKNEFDVERFNVHTL